MSAPKALITIILFTMAGGLGGGCKKIVVLPGETGVSPDWTVFGGDAQHSLYRVRAPRPPLKLLWKVRTNSALGISLLAVDGTLYFGTQDGRLFALDADTGERLGRLKTEDGLESTVAYYPDHLVVARRYGNGTLFLYNIREGKTEWKIDAGDIETEPLVVGDKIFVTALYRHADCYDARTGKKIWTFETSSFLHSSPAYKDGKLVFGSDDGALYVVDADSGQQVVKTELNAAIEGTPTVLENRVFIGAHDGHFYSISLLDGKVLWKRKLKGRAPFPSACDGRRLFVSTTAGKVYQLDGATGEIGWEQDMEDPLGTPPLVAGDCVYVGSLNRNLYCLSRESGREQWKHKLDGRVRTTPVVWNDRLFVAAEDHYVYAFGHADSAAK